MPIHGVIAPPPTPMDERGEEVNPAGVEPLVECLLAGGVHGVFANGTTGEGGLLSLSERERLAEAFVEAVDHRVPVIVQAGTTSTAGSIRLARHAADAGADAIAVVAPYYFAHDQAALERHVRNVAAAAGGLPVYLYDIPSRTQNSYGLETIRRLFEDGVVVGAKDSSGDLPRMLDMLDLPDFRLLPGADALALVSLQAGGRGVVSGPGCVFPAPYVRLWQAFTEGDLAAAGHWQAVVLRVSRALGFGADLPLLKALLRERVPEIGAPREPHRNPAPEAIRAALEHLRSIARDAGLSDELGQLAAD